jgi:glycosyltransferase involved in cell wall biosynthesis
MSTRLVSIIVPTRNSETHLARCLASIENQSYRPLEIIVVDNNSTDSTRRIAERYAARFFTWGPERSAQVNFGVAKARGHYVYKVDSDFLLHERVVESCVDESNRGFDAIVVHNSPDVTVGWIARVRKFEVEMYKYDLTHSSARFLRREVFLSVGGYNERITAGEDYDFQNRLTKAGYRTGFVEPEALHLGEPTSIWKHMRKYYRYGQDFANYRRANEAESKTQLRFMRRVYLRNWSKFVRHPVLGIAFILYNCGKYAFGGAGLLVAQKRLNQPRRPSSSP